MTEPALAPRPDDTLACTPNPLTSSSSELNYTPAGPMFTPDAASSSSSSSSSSTPTGFSGDTPAFLNYTPGVGDDPVAQVCWDPAQAHPGPRRRRRWPVPPRPPRPPTAGTAQTGSGGPPGAGQAQQPADGAPAPQGQQEGGDGTAGGPAASPGGAQPGSAAPAAAGQAQGARQARQAAAAQELNEQIEDAELALPFTPKPVPDRSDGPALVPPFLLAVDVNAAPFAAERTLTVRPTAGTRDLPGYLQTYAESYGGAVDQIRRGYDDVLAAARAQAEQLRQVQAEATSLLQRALDDGLETLDRRLDGERGALALGEQTAIDRLAMIADTARLLVRLAAQRALGTVAARKAVIQGHMVEATGERDEILGFLDGYFTRVDTGGTNASTAFTGLAGDATPARFPKGADPESRFRPQMSDAMNEDLDPVVAHHASERSTAYATAQRIFEDHLNTAHTSFLNAASSAFAPFNSYVTMLGTTAPRQIHKLRQQALKSIDRMEKRTQRAIRENRNKAEVSLVERHGQLRKRLVQQAEAMADGQNKGIQRAATAQLRGFAALAAAQAPTVTALSKRIEGQQQAQPEQFAQFVIAGSQRTGERTEELTASRLDQVRARGRTMSDDMRGKASKTASSEADTARQSADQFTTMANQTSAAMMTSALAQEAALRNAAEPVANSVDSFRIPAEAEMERMENELLDRLDESWTQAEAVWSGGGNAPQSVNPVTPATTSEQPPEGTGSTPSQFADLADARAQHPEDDPRITTMANRIGQTVNSDVHRRGDGLKPQMTLTGQNPQQTLALVRGLTYLRGQAVINYYDVSTGRSLWDDIPFYMSFGNPVTGITTRLESGRAVQDYLMGNRASGALHDIQAATSNWNDPDQAMAAMTALSPADMEALRALDPDGAILNDVEQDLGGNDGRAFHLLRTATAENAQESLAAARALRLGDKLQDDLGSHPEQGADAAFDSMQGVARDVGTTRLEGFNEYGLDANFEVETREARRARTREAWNDTVARLGNDGERRADGAAGGLRWLDAESARRRTYWKTEFNPLGLVIPIVPVVEVKVWQANVRQEQRDALHALAEWGPDDPHTRARQLAVEDTRPGGADRPRFERAYYDPRTNADMANPDDPNARMSHPRRPGDPPTDLEQGQQDDAEMLRYYDEYRNGHSHDNPRPLEDIRRDLGASLRRGTSDERLGRLFEMQVTRGLTDPETAALAFEHAVDRVGTDEQLIKDTLRRMSPDQARAAVEAYDRTHHPGLYERLGLFNHEDDWFTELSGDDRLEIQVLAMGQPRNDRERAEVSHMTSRLQKRNASWLSQHVLASAEYDRMADSHDRLLRAMGVSEADFDAFGRLRAPDGTPVGSWDERGNFRPNGEMGAIAFASAMATNEAEAGNFRTVTDNIANAVSMAIIIAAAVISTIATGGTAASFWIPALVTLAGGVVAIGANYAIKGGRYGYEDMGRDFGMAVVQAATAGLASALTIGVTGGTAALRAAATTWKISSAGLRSATLVEEAMIAGAAGAFGGAGNAMFDDKAWDEGKWLEGIGRGFERGAGGGFLGGLATGITSRAVGSVAGGIGRLRGGREAAALGLSGDQASRLAIARATAASESFGARLTARTLGGGIGGATTRAYEIGYDRSQGRYQGTSASAIDEIVGAGLQNAGQSFSEGTAEHMFAHEAPVPVRGTPSHGGEERPAVVPRAPGEIEGVGPGTAHVGAPGDEGRARAPVAANDNAPAAEARAARRAAGDEERPLAGRGRRVPAEEEAALRSPGPRPEGEQAEARRLRSGDSDEIAASERPTREIPVYKPNTLAEHLASTAVHPPPIQDTVDLSPSMLKGAPSIPEHSEFRATDPRSAEAALANYHALREADPHREVLLARCIDPSNERFGQFVVFQGGESSVSRPPEGWIAERHSHPRLVSGEMAERLARSLPSGTGGDFSVLRSEVDMKAGLVQTTSGVTRESVIDIRLGDHSLETHFSITRNGDQYEYRVSFRPPHDGVEHMGPFYSLADYEMAAGTLTGQRFGTGSGETYSTADGVVTREPPRAVHGDPITTSMHGDIEFVRQRMALAGEFDSQLRGATARGEIDPALGHAATLSDAHQRVIRMGLVGEPDSMIRLHNILNDESIPQAVRALISDVTLEATRNHLLNTGELAPGEPLVMLFHGATPERTQSLVKDGIDMTRSPGGRHDDFGEGLYFTRSLETALEYRNRRSGVASGEEAGAVIPYLLRGRELANSVDVSSRGNLRAQWEAFAVANARTLLEGGKLVATPEVLRILRGEPIAFADFGPWFHENRGQLFNDFLASIDAHPSVIFGDLGGPLTHGIQLREVTDQVVIRGPEVAEIMNRQHVREGTTDAETRLRDGPDEGGDTRLRTASPIDESAKPAAPPRPEETVETAQDTAKPATASHDEDDIVGIAARSGANTSDAFVDAMMEANAELHAPRPPAETYAQAIDGASHVQRQSWRDRAMTEFAASYPAEFARLQALVGNDPAAVRNAITASIGRGREQQLVYLVNRMKVRGYTEAQATQIAREVIGLASDMHHRFALTLRHLVEREIWSGRIAALPVAVRTMAEGSNLLLYLGAHHPDLLQQLHTQFLAQPNLQPTMNTPAFFEEFAARQLAGHPVIQAETTERRIVRFTSEADFNAATASATPNTRYEFGRLAYTTDAQGRVAMAEGVPVRVTGHRGSSSLQTEIGNRGYATDVGFHLIAHIFGAVVNELTVVPGNGKRISGDPDPNLNGSAYKVEFENIVRNILDTTDRVVEIQVASIYNSGNTSSRPDVFEVRFRTDAGDWRTARFINKF